MVVSQSPLRAGTGTTTRVALVMHSSRSSPMAPATCSSARIQASPSASTRSRYLRRRRPRRSSCGRSVRPSLLQPPPPAGPEAFREEYCSPASPPFAIWVYSMASTSACARPFSTIGAAAPFAAASAASRAASVSSMSLPARRTRILPCRRAPLASRPCPSARQRNHLSESHLFPCLAHSGTPPLRRLPRQCQ
jgi:hypothetical protein